MRDIPMLQLSAFVLLAGGLAVGGWRSWHESHDPMLTAAGTGNVAQIELLTTADKASWVRAQVYSFNYAHQGQYQVIAKYVDSREAMQRVLAGAEHPVLWSPESPVWIVRANDIWRAKTRHDLVPMEDFSAFRVFLRSPLVFLTTREKAAYLRPHLGGTHPWTSVYDICSGSIPWHGKLRFAVADPLLSNSGDAGVGMMLTEYASTHPSSGSLVDIAATPGFGDYLSTIGTGLARSLPSKSTADLTDAYVSNPSTCDFIVTYENLAFEAARRNHDLAVIYPAPTTVAEQSVAIVDARWVSAAQRQGADEFMTYVSRPESIESGLKYDMRSAVPGAGDQVETRLAGYGGQGFQATFMTEEEPPYLAVNAAAAQWHKHVGG